METDRFTAFQMTFDKIRKNIQKLEMSYLRSFGLRSVHTVCLLSLDGRERGLTVTELSRECAIDKALTSRSASELLERGFITLVSDPTDKKHNKRFVLTELGKETLVSMKGAISDYVQRADADITDAELETFYRVLYLLDRNIESIASDIQ